MDDKKKKYFMEPQLKLIEQKSFLEMAYPDSKVWISNGVLTWYGKVKTNPFSKEYDVKIEYRMGKSPRVWLLNEKIEEDQEAYIPHNYGVNREENSIQLCLYKPRNKEWMKHYSLADTIVPWAIEWIYFYEIWKVTGEWKGGGAHPTLKDRKNSDKYQEKFDLNQG